MIPLLPEITPTTNSVKGTKSPLIDFERKRITGWATERENLISWIYASLNVERYEHIIHSWQFGFEKNDLYGKRTEYVESEIKRRVADALSIDDRIVSVEDFVFSAYRHTIKVSFTVNSIYGQDTVEIEVLF